MEQSREWRTNNKGKRAEMARAWRKTEAGRAYHKRWKEANRHKSAEYENRRRARKANLPTEPIDVEELYKRDGGACYLCGKNLPLDEVVIEHKIPISRTELNPTHTYDNVGIACSDCNLSKGDKTVDEYLS